MGNLDVATVEQLKAEYHGNTRGLVKAVADRVFLAGDRPTRARVYALIQKGSSTTIDRAMREWWDALRQQTRAQVDVPGVPEALVEPFQAAVKGLWDASYAQAKAEFAEDRAKADAEVADAHAVTEATQAQAQETRERDAAAIKEAQGQTEAAEAKNTELERENAALTNELEGNQRALNGVRADLASAETAAAAAATKHERTLEALEVERRHEREVLEGHLNFANQRIEEARTKSRDLAADLERERKRLATSERAMATAATEYRDSIAKESSRHEQTVEILRKRMEGMEQNRVSLRERVAAMEAQHEAAVQAALERSREATQREAELTRALEACQQRLDTVTAALAAAAQRKEPDPQA